MGKRHLLYVDILGFEGLVDLIAKKKHVESRRIRADFIDVMKERIRAVEAGGMIVGKKYGESDDWFLVVDSLDMVFRVIAEILHHKTGYKGFEKIPLEIGIGVVEYDEWARFDGLELMIEDSTIKAVKPDITRFYHRWYGMNHNNEEVKSTFIVLSKLTYDEMEPFDKKMCVRIEYEYSDSGEKKVVVFFAANVDIVQRRGKVFQFLENIQRAGSKLYYRIDDLYVPPNEYEDIKKALATERIVFITGTPEYGKTYTALRLLWEYFGRGYEPIWRVGGEKSERVDIRKRLEEIERELQPHHIVYLEDPFGTVKYESRLSLEREIGAIISSIKNVARENDAYVLITSREEAFKEFESENLSSVELREFERKLNIKKSSYNYEKRKEILLRWAEAKNCDWLGIYYLKDFVLDSIRDEKRLPTPLSIKDFVLSTIHVTNTHELEDQIARKSQETARSFAKEISAMKDDKILFLIFPFISALPITFVRREYETLVKELKIENPWEFKEIVDWFKDDKIEISNGRVEFSHPSYLEALKHVLAKKGTLTRINRMIFCKVLLRLSENDEVAHAVAWAVRENFERLPDRVRNELLLRLSKKNEAAETVGVTLRENLGNIADEVRDGLLLRLSNNEYAALIVARITAENFEKLPDKVRDLLFKLSEKEETTWAVVRATVENFEKLPDKVRDLLFKLSEKEETARVVVSAVVGNAFLFSHELRNELLLELSKKYGRAWITTWSEARI
jgi:hypothetical protein